MGKYDDEYRREFESLVATVGRRLDADAVAHLRVFSEEDRAVEDWDPEGAGWFAELGQLRGGYGLQLWFDRYLDVAGDPHLGVWLITPHHRADALIERAEITERFSDDDRDDDGFLTAAEAVKQRRRLERGALFADAWDAGVWIGSYVAASPQLDDHERLLARVLPALRRLVSLATAKSTPAAPADRHREIVERVARDHRFRKNLIARYGARCAITGASVLEVLDAAHIRPVADLGGDHVDNGLLLRADLHRLFDAELLTIVPGKVARVRVRDELGGEYGRLQGREVGDLSKGQRAALRERNARLVREGWDSLSDQ